MMRLALQASELLVFRHRSLLGNDPRQADLLRYPSSISGRPNRYSRGAIALRIFMFRSSLQLAACYWSGSPACAVGVVLLDAGATLPAEKVRRYTKFVLLVLDPICFDGHDRDRDHDGAKLFRLQPDASPLSSGDGQYVIGSDDDCAATVQANRKDMDEPRSHLPYDLVMRSAGLCRCRWDLAMECLCDWTCDPG